MKPTKNPFGTPEQIRQWQAGWRLMNRVEIEDRRRESADQKLRALDQLYAFAKVHGLLDSREDEPRRPVLPIA